MTESFREASKAASYVTSGLTHDFPDATAEVVRTGHKPRSRECEVSYIQTVLDEMCRGFGPCFVEYHPSNAYGFVAEIRSGGANDTRPQARVYVLLTHLKGRPITVGSKPSTRPATLDLD